MAATTVPQPSPVLPALDDKAHYEVVNGRRIETPRMGSYESDLANDLAYYIKHAEFINCRICPEWHGNSMWGVPHRTGFSSSWGIHRGNPPSTDSHR